MLPNICQHHHHHINRGFPAICSWSSTTAAAAQTPTSDRRFIIHQREQLRPFFCNVQRCRLSTKLNSTQLNSSWLQRIVQAVAMIEQQASILTRNRHKNPLRDARWDSVGGNAHVKAHIIAANSIESKHFALSHKGASSATAACVCVQLTRSCRR